MRHICPEYIFLLKTRLCVLRNIISSNGQLPFLLRSVCQKQTEHRLDVILSTNSSKRCHLLHKGWHPPDVALWSKPYNPTESILIDICCLID
jgi:hypothetical protein